MKPSYFIFSVAALLISLAPGALAEGQAPAAELALKTVVLDAGHGGRDPGCVSGDGKTYEKDIVLRITLRLKELIEESFPGVNVLTTRDKDVFIPLIERARFATRNNADLFISIHINAQRKGSNANGFSVHLLGQSQDKNKDTYAFNMDVCQRENSVIYLEDDYNTNYKGLNDDDPQTAIFLNLMHTAYREQSLLFADKLNDEIKASSVLRRSNGVMQNNFAVLRLATMPAVLLELGFITNPVDLETLRNPDKLEQLSVSLFNAFSKYKEMYDASVRIESMATEIPAVSADTLKRSVLYAIQIFASGKALPKDDSRFLGYKPLVIQGSSINRYFICSGENLAEVSEHLPKVREKYPDSFLVQIIDGKEVRRVK